MTEIHPLYLSKTTILPERVVAVSCSTTHNELAILDAICHSDGQDGGDVVGKNVWCFVDVFADRAGLTVATAKGVLGSLAKKRFVTVEDYGPGETIVAITQVGFDIWNKWEGGAA